MVPLIIGVEIKMVKETPGRMTWQRLKLMGVPREQWPEHCERAYRRFSKHRYIGPITAPDLVTRRI